MPPAQGGIRILGVFKYSMQCLTGQFRVTLFARQYTRTDPVNLRSGHPIAMLAQARRWILFVFGHGYLPRFAWWGNGRNRVQSFSKTKDDPTVLGPAESTPSIAMPQIKAERISVKS